MSHRGHPPPPETHGSTLKFKRALNRLSLEYGFLVYLGCYGFCSLVYETREYASDSGGTIITQGKPQNWAIKGRKLKAVLFNPYTYFLLI